MTAQPAARLRRRFWIALRFEIVTVAIALALLLEWWFARSRALIGN